MKVDKKTLLTVASAVFGIGSVVVGLLGKEDEKNEAAEKAAEIVMNKLKSEEEEA